MSLFDAIASIKAYAKSIAAKGRYNKMEFSKIYKSLPEMLEFRKLFNDKSAVDKIVSGMPEKSFCNIVEVRDCEPHRGKCTCTKVMVFGEDDVNGKVCEQFTLSIPANRCMPNKLDLSRRCKASIVAGLCDEEIIFESYETPEFIRKKLDELRDIYDEFGHKWNP